MEKATIYNYARMCKTYATSGCHYCPLSHCKNGSSQDCGDFIKEYPDKANEIILKWCKEHPVETRQSKLLKYYPYVPRVGETVDICPRKFDNRVFINEECAKLVKCSECKREYWLAEVDK